VRHLEFGRARRTRGASAIRSITSSVSRAIALADGQLMHQVEDARRLLQLRGRAGAVSELRVVRERATVGGVRSCRVARFRGRARRAERTDPR
jgi:hypothetical protein